MAGAGGLFLAGPLKGAQSQGRTCSLSQWRLCKSPDIRAGCDVAEPGTGKGSNLEAGNLLGTLRTLKDKLFAYETVIQSSNT